MSLAKPMNALSRTCTARHTCQKVLPYCDSHAHVAVQSSVMTALSNPLSALQHVALQHAQLTFSMCIELDDASNLGHANIWQQCLSAACTYVMSATISFLNRSKPMIYYEKLRNAYLSTPRKVA